MRVALAFALAAAMAFIWWRPALYAVFLLVLVEGFLRNLFNSPEVLLLKDVALAGIYLRVLSIRSRRGDTLLPRTPINGPVLAFALISLIQSFNPQLSTPLQALTGLRAWVFYIPLYYVGLEMFHEQGDARRFLTFVVIGSLPVCALALLQFIVGPAAYSHLGPGFSQATFVTTIEGSSRAVFRPNGTFSFPSHLAVYLGIVASLCLALMLSSRGMRLFWLSGAFGVLLAVNIVENQRTVIAVLPVLLLLILVLRRSQWSPVATLGATVLALALIQLVTSYQTGQFAVLDRTLAFVTNNGVITNRVGGYFATTVDSLLRNPLGQGTGSSTLGSRYLLGGSAPLLVEFPLAKVVVDLGVLGLASYLWLFGALITDTLRGLRAAARAGLALSADRAAGAVAIQVLAAFMGYELGVMAVVLWFLSGLAASGTLLLPGRSSARSAVAEVT
jgi:hypothetical protein